MIHGNDESSSHWPQRTIRDQRQAGEISPVNQTGCEPDPIRCPCKLKCDYCRLRELLQQSAISQGVGQRYPFERVERPERTDTSETKEGSGPNDTTANSTPELETAYLKTTYRDSATLSHDELVVHWSCDSDQVHTKM